MTVHRRESWGGPLRSVLHAVRDVLETHPDVVVVLPAHPNPTVRSDVMAVLGGDRRILITTPLDYADLVRLMERSTLILSDSGGIQEEAPSFGVPVLVLPERTERVEALEAGCAVQVGTTGAGSCRRPTGCSTPVAAASLAEMTRCQPPSATVIPVNEQRPRSPACSGSMTLPTSLR